MDRLQAMKVLLAVVDGSSLSVALRRLQVPLATVSRRVAELEAQLGARLLNLTSRHLDLTETGRDYAAAACARLQGRRGHLRPAAGNRAGAIPAAAGAAVSLVHSGGRLLPRKLRAFLDLAAPRLRAAIAALPC